MKFSISGKLLLLCFAGIGGLIALMITAGLGNNQPENLSTEAAPVAVVEVILQPAYSYSQRVLARVEALESAQIGFDVGGVVRTITVEEGSEVSKGDVVATLDTARLAARKQELQANLTRSLAEQKLAQLSKNRLQNIVDKGLESAQLLDEALANVDVAQASVNQIQAQLAALQVEFNKSTIVAAFDGTVVQRHVDTGATVGVGQPVITLQSQKERQLRASLPVKLADWLAPGDLVDFANTEATAVLERFVNTQNTQTRTQDAFFKVNDENWVGRNGEIINLVVPVSQSASGMWVPLTALSGGIRGMWTVYTVSEEAEPIVSARIVEVVYADDERAYVSGALKNGERLVRNGTQRIVPGQRVRVIQD